MNNENEIRLFISSTFQDLQRERDYLSKNTFPELRRICLERGLTLVDVDLRWGIPEEEAENGQVIRICFEEIDKCRPYFIGIIGDRYGWIPTDGDVKKDPLLLEKYSEYIKEYVNEEMSITEMEFMYALQKAQKSEASFYIKEMNDTNLASSKLEQLINKIKVSGYPYKAGITNVQELSNAVIDHFVKMLDREYPNLNQVVSAVEQERRLHNVFAHTRRIIYIDNESYYRELDNFLQSRSSKLLITGESGTGKSALIANWAHRLGNHSDNLFVFTHYVGAVSSGYWATDIMKRIFVELKQRYNIHESIPDTLEELKSKLSTWLLYSKGEQIILMIDAVNQLESNEKGLSWLPDRLPAHVKLVVSTIPDKSKGSYDEWEKLNLHPLTDIEKEKLITSYLNMYGKKLTTKQLNKIIKDEKCSVPIFLKTVLDELRIFGNFEKINERIDHYLSVSSTDELFQIVLERLENDYGKEMIQSLMMYIFTSRRGLSENEIISIDNGKHLTRLNLSRILLVLDYHFMNKDGVLDFFHDYFRKAVENRYVNQTSDRSFYHKVLASYFRNEKMSQRVLEELPYHYLKSEDYDGLKKCLTDKEFIRHIQANKEYEILQYWSILSKKYDPVESYVASLEMKDDLDTLHLQQINRITSLFIKMGKYNEAVSLNQPFLRQFESLFVVEDPLTSELSKNLLYALMMTLQLDQAVEFAEKVFSLTFEKLGKNTIQTARAAFQLSDVLSQSGNYKRSEVKVKLAIEIQEELYDYPTPELSASKYLLGRELMYYGLYEEAFQNLHDAYIMQRKLFGEEHPETAITKDSLAQTNIWLGKYQEAEKLVLEAIHTFKTVLGENHHRTAKSIGTLAKLRLQEEKFNEAYDLINQTLDNYTTTLGRKHPYTAFILNYVAETLYKMGEVEQAKLLLTEANQSLLGQEKTEIAYQIHILKNLAIVYAMTNRFEGAVDLLLQAIHQCKATLPTHEDFISACEYELAKIQFIMDPSIERKEQLEHAFRRRQSLLGPSHPEFQKIEKDVTNILNLVS